MILWLPHKASFSPKHKADLGVKKDLADIYQHIEIKWQIQTYFSKSACRVKRCQEQNFSYKGDTVIGNDVWIGYEALVMPGIKIGNGAIVASRSVVVSDYDAEIQPVRYALN